MMSPDLQRLAHIYDYCVEIEETISHFGCSFEIFDTNKIFQHSLAFCILQIGELSGGLSQEYRQMTAKRVQWGPMKAMRNFVVHNYGKVNREIIWETATVDIPALKEFCEEELAKNRQE